MSVVRSSWRARLLNHLRSYLERGSGVAPAEFIEEQVVNLLEQSQQEEVFIPSEHMAGWTPFMSTIENPDGVRMKASSIYLVLFRGSNRYVPAQLVEVGGSGEGIGSRPTQWRTLFSLGGKATYRKREDVVSYRDLPFSPPDETTQSREATPRWEEALRREPISFRPFSLGDVFNYPVRYSVRHTAGRAARADLYGEVNAAGGGTVLEGAARTVAAAYLSRSR